MNGGLMVRNIFNTTMEIKLVYYPSQYKKAFKQLNEWWINTYFKIEAMGYYLDHPEKNIFIRADIFLLPC
jgi:hypothetical protein